MHGLAHQVDIPLHDAGDICGRLYGRVCRVGVCELPLAVYDCAVGSLDFHVGKPATSVIFAVLCIVGPTPLSHFRQGESAFLPWPALCGRKHARDRADRGGRAKRGGRARRALGTFGMALMSHSANITKMNAESVYSRMGRTHRNMQAVEQVKSDILDAAIRVGERDGIQAIASASVAREWGMSASSIYNYYQDITELQELAIQHGNYTPEQRILLLKHAMPPKGRKRSASAV